LLGDLLDVSARIKQGATNQDERWEHVKDAVFDFLGIIPVALDKAVERKAELAGLREERDDAVRDAKDLADAQEALGDALRASRQELDAYIQYGGRLRLRRAAQIDRLRKERDGLAEELEAARQEAAELRESNAAFKEAPRHHSGRNRTR